MCADRPVASQRTLMADDETTLIQKMWLFVRAHVFTLLTGGTSLGGLALVVLSRPAMVVLSIGVVAGSWLWHLTHLCLRYRRHLRAETYAMDVCLIGVTVLAWRGLVATPRALVVALVGAVVVMAMCLCTGATIKAAHTHPQVMSGTKWVQSWRIYRWVEGWLDPHSRGVAAPVVAVLREIRPTRYASCFITALLLGGVVISGAAFANVPAIHGFLHVPGKSWDAGGDADGEDDSDPKDYDEVCHGRLVPGKGAGQPQASTLHALWLGGEDAVGHQIDGVGAGVGGCADLAVRSSADGSTWVAIGYCEGEIRSVGMALPDGTGVIMLGQVAAFAAKALSEGRLVGASPRIAIGHGDLQMVHTVDGTYAFVRDHTSEGKLPSGTKSPPCAKTTDRDAKYTIVPPGSMASWAAAARVRWVWPRSTQQGRRIELRDGGGAVAAVVTCATPLDCADDQGVGGTEDNSDDAGNELVQLAVATARAGGGP